MDESDVCTTVSPDMQLRFDATTKPVCENKRSDAAGEAWTAKYMRVSQGQAEQMYGHIFLSIHPK